MQNFTHLSSHHVHTCQGEQYLVISKCMKIITIAALPPGNFGRIQD